MCKKCEEFFQEKKKEWYSTGHFLQQGLGDLVGAGVGDDVGKAVVGLEVGCTNQKSKIMWAISLIRKITENITFH